MRSLSIAAALAMAAAPISSFAALQVGAPAPDFQTQGALAGKVFTVKLKDALRKGPVVLYFYPAAFTPGCTVEANAFSEATPEFEKAGATVIGMSGDPLDKLQKFSVEECRNKFAVATAAPSLIKAYDVSYPVRPDMAPEMAARAAATSNRTSYVIAPDGKVIFVVSNVSPREHVARTLEAVQQWKAQKGRKS